MNLLLLVKCQPGVTLLRGQGWPRFVVIHQLVPAFIAINNLLLDDLLHRFGVCFHRCNGEGHDLCFRAMNGIWLWSWLCFLILVWLLMGMVAVLFGQYELRGSRIIETLDAFLIEGLAHVERPVQNAWTF